METGSYLPIEAEAELSEAESLKNDAGDEVDTDQYDSPITGTAGADHRADYVGAVREDHRDQRRRPALPDLRHEDAPERLLLCLRGLRVDQRLQLV